MYVTLKQKKTFRNHKKPKTKKYILYKPRFFQPCSYPEHGKLLAADVQWNEGLVWLIGVVEYLLAAPQVQRMFADASNGWPYGALRCH